MEKKLIIFDLDGTLYQTHLTILCAAQKAIIDLGYPEVDSDRILDAVGDSIDEFCYKIAPKLSRDKRKELADRISSYEKKYVGEHGSLFDHIEAMLSDLVSMGYVLALCSNGRKGYVETVLSAFQITKYFSFVCPRELFKSKSKVVGDLIASKKPDYTILVGDRIHDFEAARENNIPSVGVQYGYGGSEVEFADFMAANASEIIGTIRRCELFHLVETRADSNKENRPFVIGVNGIDTSGKTRFADDLQRYLHGRGRKAAVIHLDDFHNPRSIRNQGEDEVQSYIDNAFDIDRLEDILLAPIREGRVIDKEIQLLDLNTDTYSKFGKYRIDPDTIVILEGVLLFRAPIDEYLDCRVFLDISFNEMLRRAEKRDAAIFEPDVLEKYREKYIPVQKWYLETYDPKQNSDIVIDNTNYLYPRAVKF